MEEIGKNKNLFYHRYRICNNRYYPYRGVCLILVIVFQSLSLSAQNNFEAKDKLSKHIISKSIESKNQRESHLKINKYLKDSLIEKLSKDSIKQLSTRFVQIDSSALNQYKIQIPDLPDSIKLEDLKQEGINHGNQLLESNPEIQQARQIQEELGELPNNPDEAAQLIEQKAESYAQEYSQNLTAQQQLEQEYRKIIDEKRAIAQAEKLKKRYEMMKAYADRDLLKKKAEEELKNVANDELSKISDEQMSRAMTKLNKLKKKYGSFSSLDEIKQMKPYSLKDVPLKDRLDIGGSFQVVQGNPLSLDINPNITWWYNQRLAFGAGGTYRLQIGKVDDRFELDSDVFGFRTYSQFKLGSWFGHMEYESLNKKFKDKITEEYNGKWIPGLLFGLGKYFNIYRGIKGNVLLMYNFLHEPLESPYKHPVILRVGIGF